MDTNTNADQVPASDDQASSQPTADDQASQQQPDWIQKELKAARDEAAKYRTQLRKHEQEREEAERKRLEEQGEYKRLYDEVNAKVSQYETELAELRAMRDKVTESEEQRRKVLLEQLPEDMRPAFATASADVIQVTVAKLSASQNSTAANRQPAKPSGNAEAQPPAPRVGQPGWLRHELASR